MLKISITYRNLILNKKFTRGGVSTTTHLLKGKNVLVTGGNVGIGKATCIEIAKVGANSIYVACRNKNLGLEAVEDIKKYNEEAKVEYIHMDLSDLKTIKDAVNELESKDVHLDVLINNAGVLRLPYGKTKQGHELQVGVNHIGHFYLTNLLLDKNLINPKGRIINVSSMTHFASPSLNNNIEEILNPDESKYNKSIQYFVSKYCNILFTEELQRRLIDKKSDILTFSCHPGTCRTSIYRNEGKIYKTITTLFYPIIWTVTKDSFEGAQTILHCASHPDISKFGGKYFSDCKVKSIKRETLIDDSKKLWDYSEKFIKSYENGEI